LIWLPGDAAQCGWWFPPKKIPLELTILISLDENDLAG
jgi:hypothetical protein